MNLESYKKLSDDEIIEIIKTTKNSLLFDILYDRYSKIIFNKCLGFTKDEDDAKDLTQEVFIKLYIKLKEYKNQSKFRAWLYVFTYNICVNYVNRDKRHNEKKYKVPSEALDSLHIEVSDSNLFQLKVKALDKMLAQIDPQDRMILLLKYQDDLSIKDLSDLYQIGESAVKMRLKRAKARLIKLNSLNT